MAAGDPLIEVSDLEARLGRSLNGADLDRATALIEDASGLVFILLGTDDPWPDGLPLGAKAVICQMVIRAFENPRALAAETLGDYSWQGAQSGSNSLGIFYTGAEARALRRAYGRLSIRTVQLHADLPLRPDILGIDVLIIDCPEDTP